MVPSKPYALKRAEEDAIWLQIVERKEEIVRRGQFQRVDEEPCVKKYVFRKRGPLALSSSENRPVRTQRERPHRHETTSLIRKHSNVLLCRTRSPCPILRLAYVSSPSLLLENLCSQHHHNRHRLYYTCSYQGDICLVIVCDINPHFHLHPSVSVCFCLF